MTRPSVLYVLKEYPQISQTYIKAEIESLEDDYDITIVTRKGADVEYADHRPYRTAASPQEIREIVDEVKPDLLHSHYLDQLHVVGPLARATGIPFTLRAHSYDTLAMNPKSLLRRVRQRQKLGFSVKLGRTGPARLRPTAQWRVKPLGQAAHFRDGLRWLNDPLCLGVLAFPYSRPWLIAAGVSPTKITDVFPVIAFDRFYDRSPNGAAVMNTGVATPKKRMEDFLELAQRVPERDYHLYAMGYHVEELAALNERLGSPVEIMDPVQPEDMPAEYKRHQWLVYTADFDLATVGWPMAVAEAQASGVGVCMPGIRADLAQYVGQGGFLYDSVDEVEAIVRGPVPDHVREAGFAQARLSDIQQQRHLLTGLWDRVRQPALDVAT